jgi:iron(III) transport system permease protein
MTAIDATRRPARRAFAVDAAILLAGKILLFTVLGFCIIYPIVWVIAGSFRSDEGWTLAHYHEAFSSYYLRVMGTTLVYAVASVSVSLILGLPLAWLLARSDMPFKNFIRGCAMITFVMPPLFHAIAYVFLFQPRAGLVNQTLNAWFGVQPFNIYTLTGMVIVTALGLFPQTVLLVEAALQNIDPTLEEAAATSGAPPNQVTRKIVLPVVRPAITSCAVLGFIEVLGVFGPPAVIGIPARIYVMSTQIFADLSGFPPKFEFAAAVAMIFLVIVALVLLLQDKLLRSGAYTTVTGKGFRSRPVRLRRWKAAALAYAFFLILVGVGIPAVVLVGISLSKVWSAGLSLNNLTIEFYHEVLFGGDRMIGSFFNTLILAVLTSIATLAIGLQIATMTAHGGGLAGRFARIIAFLPFSITAVVFTLGIVLAYIRPPLALYGTLWIILICYFGRFLPFAVQPLSDGLRQIDRSLIEAGHVVGGGAFNVTLRIVLPLLKFATASTALLVFVACIREIVSIALLFSPRTETLMMTAMLVWAEGQVQLTAAIVVLLVVAVLLLFVGARLALRMRPRENNVREVST